MLYCMGRKLKSLHIPTTSVSERCPGMTSPTFRPSLRAASSLNIYVPLTVRSSLLRKSRPSTMLIPINRRKSHETGYTWKYMLWPLKPRPHCILDGVMNEPSAKATSAISGFFIRLPAKASRLLCDNPFSGSYDSNTVSPGRWFTTSRLFLLKPISCLSI